MDCLKKIIQRVHGKEIFFFEGGGGGGRLAGLEAHIERRKKNWPLAWLRLGCSSNSSSWHSTRRWRNISLANVALVEPGRLLAENWAQPQPQQPVTSRLRPAPALPRTAQHSTEQHRRRHSTLALHLQYQRTWSLKPLSRKTYFYWKRSQRFILIDKLLITTYTRGRSSAKMHYIFTLISLIMQTLLLQWLRTTIFRGTGVHLDRESCFHLTPLPFSIVFN